MRPGYSPDTRRLTAPAQRGAGAGGPAPAVGATVKWYKRIDPPKVPTGQ
jgi:hypothetical protein